MRREFLQTALTFLIFFLSLSRAWLTFINCAAPKQLEGTKRTNCNLETSSVTSSLWISNSRGIRLLSFPSWVG